MHAHDRRSRSEGKTAHVAGSQLERITERAGTNSRRSHPEFHEGVNISSTVKLMLLLVLEEKIKNIFEGEKKFFIFPIGVRAG